MLVNTLSSLLLLSSVAHSAPMDLQSSLSVVKDRIADILNPFPVSEDASEPPEFALRPELFKLHREIVSVDSLSHRENDGSEYVAKYLEGKGLNVEYLPTDDGRNNVYAYLGDKKSSSVLLTSHIDTVPPFFKYSVQKAEEGYRIYGRGAADAKGSVATQIIAFEELLQEGKIGEGDVSFLFVVGEEVGGDGMVAADKQLIADNVNWDTVIFGEPTNNDLAVGHKGLYFFRIRVYGRSCHSAYPELGVDANKVLIQILNGFETVEWPGSDLLGKTTLNVGEIDAHNAGNVVSPFAAATVVLRVASTIDKVSKLVTEIVDKYKDQALKVELDVLQASNPVYLDYDVAGFNHSSLACSTDVPNLTDRGFKKYLYGPGSIHNAHAADEYVTVDSLVGAVDDYKKLVLHAL
ncbi:DEKNAAC103071 [Brettanomyces naardenensis]|uniref:DEKNAAC103071 n=1 Tax=Brettanomyces naardenensis TaxID=13370 RepID=A0A448YMH4_BRENA|nr:DEKNAAC103071 [Brettanomyces naardenensis]